MARPVVICPKCGWKEQPSRYPWAIEGAFCYCCSWWLPWVRRRHQLNVVRHRTVHYLVEGDLEETRPYAPLGTLWEIEFFDGRVVRTRGLTCQGAIPARFHLDLPNNARSVRQLQDLELLGCGNLNETDEEEEPVCAVRIPAKAGVQQSLF